MSTASHSSDPRDSGGRLIAGAMSGTSADGVDVAITHVTGRGTDMRAKLVHHHHRAYDAPLRVAIFKLRDSGQTSLRDLARLGREISMTYALAVNEALVGANLKSSDLAAVAAHGQTLFHDPPSTIQWFDPALVAAEVGCAVVSDFRRADSAAGGQGAPLVPFADYILFRHPTKNRVLLNIGGIANLSWLRAGGGLEEVVAFDTGPGNCVSDSLCRQHDPNGPGFDVNGDRASLGKGDFQTAAIAARSEYVFKSPPKSTDGPAMVALYHECKKALAFEGAFEDELATTCMMTAHMISYSLAMGVQHWWGHPVDELLVSGGGVENKCLMRFLREAVESFKVAISLLDPALTHAKEALAFALLGAATLDGEPSNVPSVTGAKRRVVLGSITPRP